MKINVKKKKSILQKGSCVEEVKAKIATAKVVFKKAEELFDKKSEERFGEEDGWSRYWYERQRCMVVKRTQ
jgi:hypothetical protein